MTTEKFVHIAFVAILGIALFTLGFTADRLGVRDIVLGSFGFIGACLMLLRIEYSIVVLFTYLGFEGGAKLLSNYNPVVHVGADILIVALWMRIGVTALLNRRSLPEEYPPFIVLFSLHVVWFVVTIANPYALSLIASLAAAKIYITIVSLYVFGYYLATSIGRIRLFMIPWIAIGAVQVVTSIYQSSIGPSSVTGISPIYALQLEKYAGYAFRPFGTTSNPGAPNVFMYLCVPFVFYFLFHGRKYISKGFILALIPGIAITLFVCQVRSGMLKAIIGGGLFLLFTLKSLRHLSAQARRSVVAMLALAALGGIAAIPPLLNHMVSSYEDNERAIERSLSLFDFDRVSKAREGALGRFLMYVDMAPFGAGLSRTGAAAGKFRYLIEQNRMFHIPFFADNTWVAIVVDLGLPGLFILAITVLGIVIRGARSLQTMYDPALLAVQSAVFCTIIAILFGTYGSETFLYNPEGAFFWFFCGVMMRVPQLERKPVGGLQHAT